MFRVFFLHRIEKVINKNTYQGIKDISINLKCVRSLTLKCYFSWLIVYKKHLIHINSNYAHMGIFWLFRIFLPSGSLLRSMLIPLKKSFGFVGPPSPNIDYLGKNPAFFRPRSHMYAMRCS